jgi:nucleoside-diphosphate-sugar epimerase
MKVMITGSSGFIGTELVNYLKDKHEVVEFAHDKGNNILNYNKLKDSMKKCDIVIHLAAHRKPYEDKTFKDYFETNCEGTFNVAQAAMENKVKKLVFTSSTSYYGIEKGIPEPDKITETAPILTQKFNVNDLDCRDCDIAYSTSKVIAEQILANYGLTKKMQVIMLRIGPTRKEGDYRPFGKLKLHLKLDNALQAIELAIENKNELWYEAFTIMDELEGVDITKAKKLLGYNPK